MPSKELVKRNVRVLVTQADRLHGTSGNLFDLGLQVCNLVL
jgi:hypothetical protein